MLALQVLMLRAAATVCAAVALVASAACATADGGARADAGRTVALPAEWDPDRASFSPDGASIAFAATSRSGRFSIGVARSGRVRWVTPAHVVALDFAWMPASRSLLVSHRRRHGRLEDSLSIFAVDGRRLRRIPLDRRLRIEGTGIAVRRDGRTAVVAAQRPGPLEAQTDVFEVDLGSGRTRQITSTPRRVERFPTYIADDLLALAIGDLDERRPNMSAALLRFDRARTVRLSPLPHLVGRPTARWGGSEIVYDAQRLDADARGHALWTVRRGEAPDELLATDARSPSLSNDGRRVVAIVREGGRIRLRVLTLPRRVD